ncbi:MAG: prohibitin family protein [Planctomycetaceae bacterium]|nr:prohibitin family protein [Planctomycetaceae bacterium]GIK52409.1 MAG: hypothetical protein BroJett014_13820 [Planctomycetota bacterium]HRJ78592.1 SPFH domain-containing protein [Planctomycetota bacterium]
MSTPSRYEPGKPPVKLIVGGVVAVVLFFVVIAFVSSFYAVVDAGTRGVYKVFGDVADTPLEEGFHLKAPWADVENINVRQVVVEERVAAASFDLQQVQTTIAVNYYPEPGKVAQLYKKIGADNLDWERVLMRPRIAEITKAVTAKFSAENLIRQRAEAKLLITEQIKKELADSGLVVVEVSITNFDFDATFNQAIEAKQVAEQRAQQEENELKRKKIQAQQQIVEAEAKKQAQQFETDAQAYRTRISAEAEAERTKIQATAEAEAQKALAASITTTLLKWRFLEKWDGVMPKVMGGNGSILMQLGLDDDEKK